MSDPRVRIVTLTVTEKGYCHDPATGTLNEDHPDIVADLASPASRAPRRASRRGAAPPPRAGVRRSRCSAATTFPPTADGRRRRARFAACATRTSGATSRTRSPSPRRWSTASCRRPPTRTARPSPPARRGGRLAGGDRAVHAMGDRGPLPAAARASRRRGAELVARCGALRADEAPAPQRQPLDPRLSRLSRRATRPSPTRWPTRLRALVADSWTRRSTPTLCAARAPISPATSARCSSASPIPALKHRTWQIAMDGSQKLPQRLLGTIRDLSRLYEAGLAARSPSGAAMSCDEAARLNRCGTHVEIVSPCFQKDNDVEKHPRPCNPP